MRARHGTPRWTAAAALAAAACIAAAPLHGAATTQAHLPLPGADSFRAFDRPSDDGSAIVVQWARPEAEGEGLSYVVEIARSPEDFQKGQFKTQTVKASPAALKSAAPQYFGYSEANGKVYFAAVTPSDLFPPADPGPLTAERLPQLVQRGLLLEREARRAAAALANQKPDEQLAGDDLAERNWLNRLRAWVKKEDDSALGDLRQEINAQTCYFRLAVVRGNQKAYVLRAGKPAVLTAHGRSDLFKWYRLNNVVLAVLFSGGVLGFIQAARRNPNLFIRKIAGLEAIEEAIGRATEMGRSVYFVHGLEGMGSLSTIAAVNILARIARRAAEYDTRVRVMNSEPIVTAVSQEVVQQAYTEAGRPDAYDPDDVSLVASDQFSFVAAVSGRMVRERPAAIFLLGYFYAESLLLVETGASTGAIQVAGTDAYTQLPFFVPTCDYTLIGEELYAASAYLSREPRMLGSLRGQDVGKAFLMLAMVVGKITFTLAPNLPWLREMVKSF